jgi:hypothetical protein
VHDNKLPSTVTLSLMLIDKELEKRISLATEYLTIPFCEALLKDQNRLLFDYPLNQFNLNTYLLRLISF